MTSSHRGQAHTLEGVMAALLVVTGVVLALQMTAVTPLTASTANQHIETQERAAANGVLAASDDGQLRQAVLYWNDSATRFPESGSREYYVGSGPTEVRLLERLNETFSGHAIAYNVQFIYISDDGDRSTQQFVYQGGPTENAVTARRVVTLYDNDRLISENGPTNTALSESSHFAPDAAPDATVYNVVYVEVTVWRM